MADPVSILAIGGLVYAARKCSEMESARNKKETFIVPSQQIENEISNAHLPDPPQSGSGANISDRLNYATDPLGDNSVEITHPSFGDVAFMRHPNGEPVTNLYDRPYVSGQMNNFGPVEKELVGPGLGVGPDVPAYGGYQQLFRVDPNNVGAYKLTTLPGRAGPAHSVIGGAPTLAGRVNHKAPPKTAFLPTRRPEMAGRAQGQGGALTGVTVRSKYEKTKRPTNRSETTWRNDGLEFNPARSVVSAPTMAENPTRNKGDLNDGQFNYNNQPVPGITNFFGGYLESPASQIMDQGHTNGQGYSTSQLEQYGFRPSDRRGQKDREGNAGRMNVRAGPLNQGGMVTAVRTDCNKYDGRMGPANGGWTQNYVQDKYYQMNAYKGQENPYATNRELNVAKNQLKNNPLAHSIST